VADLVANSVLPARREAITLHTVDGLALVGELALPIDREPVATIICVHPNPTGGGMMDSHLYRKAAWRLPALADLAVLRFNTRGTTSTAGTSEGEYDKGIAEGLDLKAALEFAVARGLPNIWLVGWSFGTDVVLMHGNVDPVLGAILFSPPLKWSDESALHDWAQSGRALTALVPELDDYLLPDEARARFAVVPQCDVVPIPGCKHLWVGEKYVRIAWNEALKRIRPELAELSWQWDGQINKWDDLSGGLV
jgi:hypothetical protein